KPPNTKHDRTHGIPTIEISINRPASHQPRPMMKPPKTNQIRLAIARMIHPLTEDSAGEPGVHAVAFERRSNASQHRQQRGLAANASVTSRATTSVDPRRTSSSYAGRSGPEFASLRSRSTRVDA